MAIYRVDSFKEGEVNPITNVPYDSSWIAYCLTDSEEYQMMVGNTSGFIYTARVSRKYDGWKMSVCDFLQFQEKQGKNIILDIRQTDLEEAQNAYLGHTYNDPFLRDDEPDVLIHSTTYENWLSIQKDGCLKSWNTLKTEKKGWEAQPIGQSLGDPSDFSDYIMFSGGHISSEIVVLSKQNGRIIMDPNAKYKTGARLYFDIQKIAKDGLLIRDGLHLKVKNTLPLEPYLLWRASWDTVGLENDISTPKEFTERSNETFNRLFSGKVKTTF